MLWVKKSNPISPVNVVSLDESFHWLVQVVWNDFNVGIRRKIITKAYKEKRAFPPFPRRTDEPTLKRKKKSKAFQTEMNNEYFSTT